MLRTIAAALAAIVGLAAAGAARADFSACESAMATKDPGQQVDLYTLCLSKGGVPPSDVAGAFNNRGVAYLALGEEEKAFADFNAAIQYDPKWGISYANRGRGWLRRGDLAKAEADFDKALQLPPARDKAPTFVERAEIRSRRGDFKGALADLKQANFRNHGYTAAQNAEAWLLATCPDASLRDGGKAVELATKAVAADPDPAYRDTLATAYAEAGRFEDAAAEESRAIAAAGAGAGRELKARLELFKAGKPFHEAGPANPA